MSQRRGRAPLQKPPKGVAETAVPLSLDRSKVDWDDLRVFLRVAEAKTLSGAANLLGMQFPTVKGRIKDLEDALGAALLVISPNGIHLTDVGKSVLQRARDVGLAVTNIERDARSASHEASGLVRLSITEGLGVYWLIPRLIEFQFAHPRLIIDTRSVMEVPNTLSLETDVAVQLRQPKGDDLRVIRLGTLHVLPFVSLGYAERFGIPKTVAEFTGHKVISQAANQLDEDGLLKHWEITRPEGVIAFRTSSSVTHYSLVKKGAGIGALASYAGVLDPTLIPIELPDVPRRMLDIWLTFHAGVKEIPHVAALIDYVRTNFDKARFPWFRDEYVSVADLRGLPDDDWKVNLIDFH